MSRYQGVNLKWPTGVSFKWREGVNLRGFSRKDLLPLKTAFITLELKPELKLVYKVGKNFKFLQREEFWNNAKLGVSQFVGNFSQFIRKEKNYDVKNLESRRLGESKIYEIFENTEKVFEVIKYLNDNIRQLTEVKGKELAFKPFLDFNNRNAYLEFANHIKSFQLLSDLELISFERFELKKLNTNFSFDDASSGEYHIILTFLNILSLIEENSLVFLDEPEISLHPNWQIKYMDIFNKMFVLFPGTHFIIASHSHFLVSDLKGENSSIMAIDIDEAGEIKITSTPRNTYGWSAEQILLDVFKVATIRNFYITKTVTDVLKEMSEVEPNYQLIKTKLEEIIFLDIKDFNQHDPILDIFKELKTFYNELN